MFKSSFGVFVISFIFTLTLLDVNDAIVMNVREFKAPVKECFDIKKPFLARVIGVSCTGGLFIT